MNFSLEQPLVKPPIAIKVQVQVTVTSDNVTTGNVTTGNVTTGNVTTGNVTTRN